MVNLIALAVGIVADPTSTLLILVPVLLPAATAFGIDPLHFGMILIVNLMIGRLTPPVGIGHAGSGQGAVAAQFGPRMAAGDFAPRGRAVTHLKAIRNAATAAAGAGLDLPVTRALLAQFAARVDRHGDVDHAGLILMLGTDGAGTGGGA